jgi:hypothetical protein
MFLYAKIFKTNTYALELSLKAESLRRTPFDGRTACR